MVSRRPGRYLKTFLEPVPSFSQSISPFRATATPFMSKITKYHGFEDPYLEILWFYEKIKDAGRPYESFPPSIAPRSLLCVRKRRNLFSCFMSFSWGAWTAKVSESGGRVVKNWGLGIHPRQPTKWRHRVLLEPSLRTRRWSGWREFKTNSLILSRHNMAFV